MKNAFSRDDWDNYYSRKRVIQQWTQIHLLNSVDCHRILEIGPAYGLVTSMLVNAGYQVSTLDITPRSFARPDTPHITGDLRHLTGEEIAGFDAILCCETLEHIEWVTVPRILATFRASGASYLVISVPYMEFQITLDLYLNAHTWRQYFSLKKLRGRKTFKSGPPGDHQWEVGFKGYSLQTWEVRLKQAGWSIVTREFTEHCRSVFHLLKVA